MSDLLRRSYIGICTGGDCVSDLWCNSYIGVCRAGVCVSSKSVLQACQERVSDKSVK